jgi:hypothetical protein
MQNFPTPSTVQVSGYVVMNATLLKGVIMLESEEDD